MREHYGIPPDNPLATGDVLGVAVFMLMLAAIMLWLAGRDDRPHLIKIGL